MSRYGVRFLEATAIAHRTQAWSRLEFAARFERLRPRLTAICCAVAGNDDGLDLVQETFLRAYDRLPQLRDPGLFDAWVVRIALNEARSLLRERKRSLRRSRELSASRHGEVRAPSSDGSEVGIRELVERLPQRERAVIILYYSYGYRMSEIGRLLGLSHLNTRVLAYRARRRLREQLEEAMR